MATYQAGVPQTNIQTRTSPTGDYTVNAWGGTTFTPNPLRVAQDRATMQQATGQVMPPQYDIPGSGGGVAGYGSGGGSGTGGGGVAGYGSPYTSPGGASLVTNAGSGGGNINLSRDAYEAQQAMQLRAKLANDAFGRVSGVAGGAPGAQVQYGGGAAGEQARAAAFARAKEAAGQNANAALKSMQDIMGRRGLRGSSIEAGATGDIISSGGQDISKVITQQMQDELANIQHVNDVSYQGGIQQRGQDINAKQSMLSLLAGLY